MTRRDIVLQTRPLRWADVLKVGLVAVVVAGVCFSMGYLWPRPEPPTPVEPWSELVVYAPRPSSHGWVVVSTYNGIVTESYHVDEMSANRLYAVLAGRMMGGER